MTSETEQQRRYTDHLKHISEHDMLIRLNTKMDAMCKKADVNKADLDTYMAKMDARCEHRMELCSQSFESKLSFTTYWKILTIIVLVLFAFGGTIAYNSKMIVTNSAAIKEQKQTSLDMNNTLNLIAKKLDIHR